MRKFGPLIAVLVLLTGCWHAPVSYHLLRQGAAPLLVPPAQAVSQSKPSVQVSITNARKNASSHTDCDIDGPLLTLNWDRSTAKVRLKSETYVPETANQVVVETPGGINVAPSQSLYLAPVESLDEVRKSLLSLEENGCLTANEGQNLIRALVENLPLPPDVAYLLRFGSYGITKVFDLTSDFRLQVVSPIYAQGATTLPGQPIGYETAEYVFVSAKKGSGVRISLDSVTETVGGGPPLKKSSTQNTFSFPESFGYFRLLFRIDVSSQLTIATVMSASDVTKLNKATEQRETGPSDFCQSASTTGVTCMSFPPGFGVIPELRVRVNGQESFVRVSGTVREAMNVSAFVTTAPKTLMVRRLFQGHLIPVQFDPASQDILNFVLMPGDEITW